MTNQGMAINLLIDPDTGSILSASSDMADFYGYSAQRLIGMNISDIVQIPVAEIGIKIGHSTYLQAIPLSIRRASGEIRSARAYASFLAVDHIPRLFMCIFEQGLSDDQLNPVSDPDAFLDLGFLHGT